MTVQPFSNPQNSSTSDAVAREAAWLRTSGDDLPALLKPLGKWDVIQGYWPGQKFSTQLRGIYLWRPRTDDLRLGGGLIQPRYTFRLKLHWPVKATGTQLAETEQQNFDNAIADLVLRVRGFPGDKTHAGWFSSAGEVPRGQSPSVEQDDAELTIKTGQLSAVMTYQADDFQVNG